MTVAERVDYRRYITSIATSHDNGTGFFIGPDLLCTCYHVVKDCDVSDITIHWQDKDIHIEDCSCYENLDLVFIKTRDAGNMGWLPFNPSQTIVEGMTFQSFGYPIDHETNGSPLLLTYSGADKTNKILTFSQDNVTPGYSGSPIVTSGSNRLVGMLGISRDISTPSGGRGLSANYILEALCKDEMFYIDALQMPQSNELFSAEDCQWVEDNPWFLEAIQKYLHSVLRNRAEPFDYHTLVPYFQITKFGFSDNPYILLAHLISEKFSHLSELYRAWLSEHTNHYDSRQTGEALQYVLTSILPFPKNACESAIRFQNSLKNIRIAGSSMLLLNSLLSPNNSLLVSYNLRFLEKSLNNHSIDEITCLLLKLFADDRNIFFLADPGVGKSTLSILLFAYLQKLRTQNKMNFIPVYVNLKQETYGVPLDDKWLVERIQSVYGQHLSSNYWGEKYSNVILILDGLDEFLSRQADVKVKNFFSNPIFALDFQLHIAITCREQFYYRYVQYDYIASQYATIHLLPWNIVQKKEYISAYVQAISNTKERLATRDIPIIQSAIFNNQFINDLSDTPLYLNMSIELLCDDPNHRINSLIDLYEQFTDYWMNQEFNRVRDKYSNESLFDQASFLLPLVSWKYFNQIGTRFSKSTILVIIKNAMADIGTSIDSTPEELADFITYHTFFVCEKCKQKNTTMTYVHKSFLEFFVSKFIFNVLSNPQCAPDQVIDVHKEFLPHEVSEFIKEHFQNNNTHTKVYTKKIKKNVFNNCKTALDRLGNDIGLDEIDLRTARQQLTYHVGQVDLPSATQYLKQHLQSEKDLWTKRTIILGLSFSGDESELTAYIDRMRTERKSGSAALESEVNIGFSLSFFGDQSLNDEHPEIDQGHANCKNTIIRLMQQLSTSRNRPSWHNDLYTLVDLANNRPVSEQDYKKTIRDNKEQLLEILVDVEHFDNQTKQWREIQEMRDIINQIC